MTIPPKPTQRPEERKLKSARNYLMNNLAIHLKYSQYRAISLEIIALWAAIKMLEERIDSF